MKKPTELKKVQGTFRPDREPKNKPLPKKVTSVDAPDVLNDFAKQEWERIVPEMIRVGILTSVDLASFTITLMLYGIAMESYQAIFETTDEDGNIKKRTLMEYTKGKSQQAIPEVTMFFKALESYKKMIGEFGLTPAARMKLEVMDGTEKENPFEKFKD